MRIHVHSHDSSYFLVNIAVVPAVSRVTLGKKIRNLVNTISREHQQEAFLIPDGNEFALWIVNQQFSRFSMHLIVPC